jgi:CMP-2-keto-3-deoxyoctulosonic acid synthetase
MEAGMNIAVGMIAEAPGGIDTAEDLSAARSRLSAKGAD